jgi:hypothetical protein
MFKAIKMWLVKRKDKSKGKKITVGEVIVAILLLFVVLTIVAFTSYGADVGQWLIHKNPKEEWVPWLQFKVAKSYSFWGETKKAANAFRNFYSYEKLTNKNSKDPSAVYQSEENYYQDYPNYQAYHKQHPELLMEAEYYEISNCVDGEQFETAKAKLEEFMEKYAGQEETVFFKKAIDLLNGIKTMDQSKMYNHPWF